MYTLEEYQVKTPSRETISPQDFTIIKKDRRVDNEVHYSYSFASNSNYTTTKTLVGLNSSASGYNEHMKRNKLSRDKYTTIEEMAKINHSNKFLSFLVLHFARYSGEVTKTIAYVDKKNNTYLKKPREIGTEVKTIYLINE